MGKSGWINDRVFADTNYWIALINARDQLHNKAIAISERLSAVEIVTSEMVLVEVLNGFSNAGWLLRDLAASSIQALRLNPRIRIIPQTDAQFRSALERYKQARDKSSSLTDCASFQIMDQERMIAAITHDQHFIQAGYEALLR